MCLRGLSLPRNGVARLTDRPDMTIAVYHGNNTTPPLKLNVCAFGSVLTNSYSVLDVHGRTRVS